MRRNVFVMKSCVLFSIACTNPDSWQIFVSSSLSNNNISQPGTLVRILLQPDPSGVLSRFILKTSTSPLTFIRYNRALNKDSLSQKANPLLSQEYSFATRESHAGSRLCSVVINWEKMGQAIVNIPGIPLQLRRITWGVSTFLVAGILRYEVCSLQISSLQISRAREDRPRPKWHNFS